MDDKNYMKIKLGTVTVEGNWAAHLSSVSVKESLEALDSAQVTFDLPEGSGAELVPKVDLYGQKWEIEIMQDGASVKTYAGDIVSVQWTRSGGAPRQVTVTGVGFLHRLKRGRANAAANDRRWRGKKASEILQKVAQDWTLGTSGVQATDSAIDDFEWKTDDAALVKELAQTSGYIVRCDVDGGNPVLVFASRENYTSGEVELEFGVDILDMNATHSIDRCVSEVAITAKDPSKPDQNVEAKSTPSDLVINNDKAHSGPELLGKIGNFPHRVENKDGNRPTQSSITEQAKGVMVETAESFCEGSLTCRFNPAITGGKKVKVKGAGWPFDGIFIVKEVTHTFDASGYRTQVTFSSNSIAAPS